MSNKPKLLTLEEYPQILTAKELCEFLRISKRTLINRRSIGDDLPPNLSYSRTLKFSRDEVKNWLQKQGTSHAR